MRSWIFSIITPVFRVTWSFRNNYNMLICCSKTHFYYYQCCKYLCSFVFYKNCNKCFSGLRNRKFKEWHLFEVEIVCNIINVFTVTFDQFNASLLNKVNHLFEKNLTNPKLLWLFSCLHDAFYCEGFHRLETIEMSILNVHFFIQMESVT